MATQDALSLDCPTQALSAAAYTKQLGSRQPRVLGQGVPWSGFGSEIALGLLNL